MFSKWRISVYSYSEHLDELLEYYTKEYNRKLRLENNKVNRYDEQSQEYNQISYTPENSLYIQSLESNIGLHGSENVFGLQKHPSKRIRFPESNTGSSKRNSKEDYYSLGNQISDDDDYAFNTVPNQFLVPGRIL